MRTVIVMAALLLAGPAIAQSNADDPPKTISERPTGEGDPEAITCRPPQQLPESRLRGPQVCRTNRVWAQYRKDGMDVAPDGVHDIRSKMNCHSEGGGGGGGATSMARVGGGVVCE